jgi:hypothetical protein
MRQFMPKPGTRSATRILNAPFTDIATFSAVVQELIRTNPLGCVSYRTKKRHLPPVMIVRERYTAKFVYVNEGRKQIGTSSEVYDSVEGYYDGIHAVMSNMANTAAHRGRVCHVPAADRFSVIMKCHDESDEFYFISLARDRITVASYTSDAVLERVKRWMASSAAVADAIPGEGRSPARR